MADPALIEAASSVCRDHELVPWMGKLFMAGELEFRPLPDEMLAVLRTSSDFETPVPGQPTLFHLSAGDEEASLMLYRHPRSGDLYVMVPKS